MYKNWNRGRLYAYNKLLNAPETTHINFGVLCICYHVHEAPNIFHFKSLLQRRVVIYLIFVDISPSKKAIYLIKQNKAHMQLC